MPEVALKPCPFCGSRDIQLDNDIGPTDESFLEFVVCAGCGAKMEGEDYIGRWNSRPSVGEKEAFMAGMKAADTEGVCDTKGLMEAQWKLYATYKGLTP